MNNNHNEEIQRNNLMVKKEE